jgi:GT2 family glycosyltransferase
MRFTEGFCLNRAIVEVRTSLVSFCVSHCADIHCSERIVELAGTSADRYPSRPMHCAAKVQTGQCSPSDGSSATEPSKHSAGVPVISLPTSDYDIVGSIVIYKTDQDEVQRAIDQFLAVPLKTHLCVIDNSPHRSKLRLDPCKASYHFTGKNLGYGRAHNLALRAAHGRSKYSLVMNTDIQYSPEAVCRLYEYLQANPAAGLAAPKMLYPDGSLQYVCRLLPTPFNLFLRRFLPGSQWAENANHTYELRFWDHQSHANLPYFQGSFLLVRTELCNHLSGFDERFFMYGEDIDLSRRLNEVSETVYVPTAQVTHEYRRFSNKSIRGTWVGIQNNVRYFNKWGWFFDSKRRRVNAQVMRDLQDPLVAVRSIQGDASTWANAK